MYSNFNALMHNVQKWSEKLWRCALLITYVYFDIVPFHSIDLFLYSLKISENQRYRKRLWHGMGYANLKE